MALSAAIVPTLAVLQYLEVWPSYKRVLWTTAVLGLAAVSVAAVGAWKTRVGLRIAPRFILAACLGLMVCAMGPVLIRADTPLYRRLVLPVVCKSGMRPQTRAAIDRKIAAQRQQAGQKAGTGADPGSVIRCEDGLSPATMTRLGLRPRGAAPALPASRPSE